ncbi:MAG: peptidyl-prolyl cis-trans isomerase B (cyclophilin B) [Candidatus Marinamargulisbacteria bacterium]|jgi:peptidyl-prolyl cis-trans isomerase B (cyclophilin B)
MSKQDSITATIKTDKGDIRLSLFSGEAPATTANFINLSERGFYDGLTFHRVIEDFMIQGGCPNGVGNGGPGYQFEDECSTDRRHDKPGVLSMANSGPNSNGSQFFITHIETPWLDGKHTVFGEVVSESDIDVINTIGQNDKIIGIEISGDTADLKKEQSAGLAAWNDMLDEGFSELRSAN